MRNSTRLLGGLALATLLARAAIAQAPATTPPPDDRLKADILVVAPHPDDETTIAGYLARAALDEHRRVSVVFTTRGDAGQNLVGTEQAASLAEIRELEARQALASIGIDHVWFVRVPDTPGGDVEDVLRSLETADHGHALGEVVRFIRLTRPEVVIGMLPDEVVGENHEDHQASGVLATEAFDLAGDPTRFPEQVASPEDRLWYGNKMEGLHPWQPKKLYYYTDATHLDFMKGKGPEYSMTAISSSRHVSYARLAATEQSFHRTQYGDAPARALATNDLHDFDQPLPFVRARSLIGGAVTADILDGTGGAPVAFAPVRGYRPPANEPPYALELGGAWAFYRRFYQAHDLEVMPGLLAPEIGAGSGAHFSVPLVMHNDTDSPVTFHLRARLPAGWGLDSTTAQHAHAWPVSTFAVPAHADFAVRIRLVAPRVSSAQWQTLEWVGDANGRETAPAALRVYVR